MVAPLCYLFLPGSSLVSLRLYFISLPHIAKELGNVHFDILPRANEEEEEKRPSPEKKDQTRMSKIGGRWAYSYEEDFQNENCFVAHRLDSEAAMSSGVLESVLRSRE